MVPSLWVLKKCFKSTSSLHTPQILGLHQRPLVALTHISGLTVAEIMCR